MGACTSSKTPAFDDAGRLELQLVISRPVNVLTVYQNTNVGFSNAHQSRLTHDLMGLKKFAKEFDPYMHCEGSSPEKKKKLQERRRSRSEEEKLLLGKLWTLYLLAQRFTSWGQLTRIQDKERVSHSIQLFIQTHAEMMDILVRFS